MTGNQPTHTNREIASEGTLEETQIAFCKNKELYSISGMHLASVNIISIFNGGSFRQGTGTIIAKSSKEGSANKILTASHLVPTFVVGPDGDRELLSEVRVFDMNGRLISKAQPVVSGEVTDLFNQNDADMIFDDLAVLQPIEFSQEIQIESWNSRGAIISKKQPSRILALFQPRGSISLNAGMSGAGVFDESGEVIGVYSYQLYRSGDPFAPRIKTGYHHYFQKNNGDSKKDLLFSKISNFVSRNAQNFRVDNVGYAVPVVHSSIRDALGLASPSERTSKDGIAWISGYPLFSCLSIQVKYLGTVLPKVFETLRGETRFPDLNASQSQEK